ENAVRTIKNAVEELIMSLRKRGPDEMCTAAGISRVCLMGILYVTIFLGLAIAPSFATAQTWHTETVDPGSGHEVGEFSSCAVDHDGNLHAAYWDATTNAPRGSLLY